jgi:hypothetical protein
MRELGAFLARFVRPLVAGGELHVGEPIAEAQLAAWEVELDVESELETIDEARGHIAAQLLVRAPALRFGGSDLRLAAAVYNTLVLLHPRTEGWTAKGGRRELARHVARLAAVPAAESRLDLVARHALLHNLCQLTRVDTKVTWWTGKAEFRGAPAPRRLTRWRTLRRVREEQSELALGEFAVDGARDLLGRLLGASPLTDLMTLPAAGRGFVPFRWNGQAEVLRDAELARAVAYRWLEALDAPLDAPARLRGPALAAAAWERALGDTARGGGESGAGPSHEDVRAITGFLVHLNVLVALAESAQGEPGALSPLLTAALGAAPKGGRKDEAVTGAATFFAIPEAAARVDARLVPPGLADDPRLARRYRTHRDQARLLGGEARVAQLERKLRARLGG